MPSSKPRTASPRRKSTLLNRPSPGVSKTPFNKARGDQPGINPILRSPKMKTDSCKSKKPEGPPAGQPSAGSDSSPANQDTLLSISNRRVTELLQSLEQVSRLNEDTSPSTAPDKTMALTRSKLLEEKVDKLQEENSEMQMQIHACIGTIKEWQRSSDQVSQSFMKQASAGIASEARVQARFSKDEMSERKAELRASLYQLEGLERSIRNMTSKLSYHLWSKLAHDNHTDPFYGARQGAPQEINGFYHNVSNLAYGLKVESLVESDGVRQQLVDLGLLNQNVPQHVQIDFRGMNPRVFLEAALNKTLYEEFLSSPFFLAEQDKRAILDRELSRLSADESKTTRAVVKWRIATMAHLELVESLDKAFVAKKVDIFWEKYGFLIRKNLHPLDYEWACVTFQDFARLALKLWKVRTVMTVYGLQELAEETFDLKSDHLECPKSAREQWGEKLNGMPFQILLRPLIFTERLDGKAEPEPRRVLSEAKVWLWNHDPLHDPPQLQDTDPIDGRVGGE